MKPLHVILPAIAGLLMLSCNSSGTGDQDGKANDSLKVDTTLTWSQRMAETIMHDYPNLWDIEDTPKPKWTYTHGLVGQAFLKLWKETGNEKYYKYTKAYADTMMDNNGGIKRYKMSDYNIDNIKPGKIYFTFYKKTGDKRYKNVLDTLRQQLREHPRTDAGGFWHKKRYPHQMWLDGLYMGGPFYAQYALEFNEPESFDDIANWFIVMEEKARDPETGLLYHGWDESREQEWADNETGLSSHFWGRGMGWYSMALVDVLDYIPEDHDKRDDIIGIIQRLAEAIVPVQHPEKGVWYQVLDQGNREGNYLEGSVSSMFSYFLLKAVDKGYINKDEYLPVAEKAYEGITKHLMKQNDNGTIEITPVCAVAGLGGDPYRDGSYEYYINERKRNNDPKAVGPFIMAGILYDKLVE